MQRILGPAPAYGEVITYRQMARARFRNPDKIHMARLGREKTAVFVSFDPGGQPRYASLEGM